MDARQQRGLVIAATTKLVQKGPVWIVPSQKGDGKYTVCADEKTPFCSCPDHEETGLPCKHIYAVQFTIRRERQTDGTVVETEEITFTKKKQYPQNWPVYDACQMTERDRFRELLFDLLRGDRRTRATEVRSPPDRDEGPDFRRVLEGVHRLLVAAVRVRLEGRPRSRLPLAPTPLGQRVCVPRKRPDDSVPRGAGRTGRDAAPVGRERVRGGLHRVLHGQPLLNKVGSQTVSVRIDQSKVTSIRQIVSDVIAYWHYNREKKNYQSLSVSGSGGVGDLAKIQKTIKAIDTPEEFGLFKVADLRQKGKLNANDIVNSEIIAMMIEVAQKRPEYFE